MNHRYRLYFLLSCFVLSVTTLAVAQEQPQPEKRYVRYRLIEVARKSLADSILVQLQQGVSFQKLARQHSLHASAKEGGEIGWAALDSVGSDFKTAMILLPIGETSAILQKGNHFFILHKMNELAENGYLQWKKQKAEVDSLLKKIESFINTGNNSTAMTLLRETEKLVKQIEDGDRYFKVLNFKSTALQKLSQFRNAAVLCDSMLKISQTSGDTYWEGVALGNLGTAYRRLGQYQRAIDFYEGALVIVRKIGNLKGEGDWLGALGTTYRLLSQYPQAIAYHDSALAISRKIGDPRREGSWLGGLGSDYLNLGQYYRAITYYDSALGIARAIGDRASEGVHLGNQGYAYSLLGQHQQAIAYYDRALSIARKNDDRSSEGAWLGMLGNTYHLSGQYQQAIAYHDSALSIARKNGERLKEGERLGDLGNAYDALGQYSKAIAYSDSALGIAREIGDRKGEGIRLGNLGNAYLGLGQYFKAIAHFEHALAIAREIGDRPQAGMCLGNLGLAYRSLDQYQGAIAYFDSALFIAREIGGRMEEGWWLGALGDAYGSLGEYSLAITYADSALFIAKEIASTEDIWRVDWSLAMSYSKMPETKNYRVISFYDNAVEALEKITGQLIQDVYKLSFLKEKQKFYQDYINYLMAQAENPYHERALEISEASRTRALRDLLQGQRIQAPHAVEKRVAATKRTEELFRKYADAHIAQTKLSDALRAGIDDSLETWAAQILIPPDTLGSTEGAPAIRMREIEAEAKASTLLEYHVLDDGVAIWVVNQSGKVFSFKQNISKSKLQSLIDSARQVLGVAGFAERNVKPVASGRETRTPVYKPVLQTLDSLLIQPITRYLPSDSNRELVILPHDILFLLPFSGLMDSSGKYLAERYTFSTAPSVGLLKFTRGRIREQQYREKPKLLLMGNPAMPDTKRWPPLPGAEQEVQQIAQYVYMKKGAGFQAKGALPLQATPLVKAQASEAEFRRIAGVQNYLHLATHGYLVSDALRCGLVLAKTGNTMETDGILTTAEIFGLPLNAELVVLSACQTGLGQISSDGVAGLSRAFLYAGASSLIVSLWKVSDAATQYLMVKFYEELARDGDKARALRAAQLFTMKKYPHPKDWAAFVLVGQPR